MKLNFTRKNIISFLAIAMFLIAWGIILSKISPVEMVETLGVSNGYLVVFLIALFGGVSTFTGISYYATVVIFAIGGLDPWIMAICAAPGLTIGDSLFYYLGSHGHNFMSEGIKKKITKVKKWITSKPKYVMSLFVYLYSGFTPFPGDLLMLSMAMMDYKFKKILIPLFFGNATLVVVISYLAIWGLKVF